MGWIIRYYKWLYRGYNKVALTAGNKVLVRNDDNTYRPAGVKGQIIGNVVVTGVLSGMAYVYYLLGKEKGKMEAHIDELNRDLDEHRFTPAP